MEQLIDTAARELGLDPVELRRRNTIPPEAMPFKTGLAFIYDCGEFERNMDDALAPLGVDRIAMPATPERIWRAIRDAEAGAK